jgi:hypothetical protein
MRPFHAASRVSVLLATTALSSFMLNCSAEDPAPAVGASGSSAAPAVGGSSAGSFATPSGGLPAGGGAPSAGSTGFPTAAGTGSGGVAGSSGGSGFGGFAFGGAGMGGAAGGSGGAAGGGGGAAGSGSGPTFAMVKEIITKGCGGMLCHEPGSAYHMDWVTESTLYNNLMNPIPTNKPMQHCKGSTPVTPGNAEGSLLYKALMGETMCMNGNMTEKIGKMPDECPTKSTCLTQAQIQTIHDWIQAGAKM